jgi:hypothetical protein
MPKVTAQPGVWLRHHTGEAERGASVVKTYQWTPVRHPRPQDGTASYRVPCMQCKKMVLWTVTNAADMRWARAKWRRTVSADRRSTCAPTSAGTPLLADPLPISAAGVPPNQYLHSPRARYRAILSLSVWRETTGSPGER